MRAAIRCTILILLNRKELYRNQFNPYWHDDCGGQRYYKNIITIYGKSYVPMNHWYGPGKSKPNNRTPFLSWVKKKPIQL